MPKLSEFLIKLIKQRRTQFSIYAGIFVTMILYSAFQESLSAIAPASQGIRALIVLLFWILIVVLIYGFLFWYDGFEPIMSTSDYEEQLRAKLDLGRPYLFYSELEKARQKLNEGTDELAPGYVVAASQLQGYIESNRGQINSIYRLSMIVMAVGFIFILFAIILALVNPTTYAAPLVAGTGGVITEFIGATFLLLYRSAVEQAQQYIFTLDKQSSVSIALKIIDEVKDGDKEKDAARIEIAKLLISEKGNAK